MNKKKIIILILILILSGILLFVYKEKSNNKVIENKSQNTGKSVELNDKSKITFLLLDGFPIDKIPLYKIKKVSSNKIFLNTDPKNISEFGDKNFSYYNVVFDTEATQKEFFDYYKSLFESLIADESESREMVKGKIGEYRVSAAYYGENKTGYIQVHLPNYQDENLDKYFVDYPDIFKPNEFLIEHEKSHGLLNQKGGEIEYTKYFTVIDSGDKNNDGKDDIDEFKLLEDKYKEEYKSKLNYQFDDKSKTLKWSQEGYEVTLSITSNHGRIYLMLRKSMTQ
jgi:hypothetical protein